MPGTYVEYVIPYVACMPYALFCIPAADRNGEREDGEVPNVPAPGSAPRAGGLGFGGGGLQPEVLLGSQPGQGKTL